MKSIPAYCDNCNSWTDTGIALPRATIRNVLVPCRNCGRNGARFIDGTYDMVNGVVSELNESNVTVQQLKELTSLLNRLANREIQPEQAQEIINREFSWLRKLNALIRDNPTLAVILIPLILGAVGTLLQQMIGNKDDAKQIMESQRNETNRIIQSQKENADRLVTALDSRQPKPESNAKHQVRPVRPEIKQSRRSSRRKRGSQRDSN